MVDKGKFIDFAISIKDNENISTPMQCIVELSIKIKILEERIKVLEAAKEKETP